MFVANCNPPNVGNRTARGEHGDSVLCCTAHMEPMGNDEAAAAWLSITQAMKDNPASVGQAKFIIRLAKRMVQPLPEGCMQLLAAQQPAIHLAFTSERSMLVSSPQEYRVYHSTIIVHAVQRIFDAPLQFH